MANNAHRNVRVDITGDSSDLERAYENASKKAKDLDNELDRNADKDKKRWDSWFASIEGATKVGDSLLKGFSGQAQLITAAVIAGFALLGPAAAATSSLITLAFGAALTGIAVLAAAESVKVRGEFADMWQDIKNDIVSISGPIEQSLLRIPAIWRGVVSEFRPHLEHAFNEIAPALDRFIEGWSVGFQQLIPAIQPLTNGIRQLFLALGNEGPAMFKAFGDAIVTLSNTAAQHADMFAGMLTGIFQLTDGIARFLDYIANDWESSMASMEDDLNAWLGMFGGEMRVNLSDVTDKFRRIAETGITTVQRLREIKGGMDGVKVSSEALKGALDELTGVHITADEAVIKYHDALADLRGQVEGVSGSLDLNTVAGRVNALKLLDLAKAANAVLVARAGEGAKTDELTGIYIAYRSQLIEAIKFMGHSERKAEQLADRYLKIPKSINTTIRADVSPAQRELDNFIITNSGREIPIHVYNKISQLADGGYIGYPNGGLVRGPGGSRTDSIPARVSRGEFVVNAAATRRHLPLLESINSGRGVGGAGTTVIYQINTTVGPTANLSAVGAEIVKSIQAYERGNGGGWRST